MRGRVSVLVVFLVGCGGNVVFVADGDGDGGTGAGSNTGGSSSFVSGTTAGTMTDAVATVSGTTGVGAGGVGGASPGGTISCFGSVCDAQTQECCATQNSAQCLDAGQDCNGLTLECSDASTCPDGEVCCAHGFGQGGDPPIAECRTQCGGGGMGGGGFQLCASDAECLNGQPCVEAFGGMKVCGGMMGPGGGPGPG
jgi:hypothetical protein